MSGGSFNYLCFVDADDVPNRLSDLDDMAEALRVAGYLDAAEETLRLKMETERYIFHTQLRCSRLCEVWKAMEWWHSADSSQDAVESAIVEYRLEQDSGPAKAGGSTSV